MKLKTLFFDLENDEDFCKEFIEDDE